MLFTHLYKWLALIFLFIHCLPSGHIEQFTAGTWNFYFVLLCFVFLTALAFWFSWPSPVVDSPWTFIWWLTNYTPSSYALGTHTGNWGLREVHLWPLIHFLIKSLQSSLCASYQTPGRAHLVAPWKKTHLFSCTSIFSACQISESIASTKLVHVWTLPSIKHKSICS